MADYFTNLSLIVELPHKAAQTYALDLDRKMMQALHHDETPADVPEGFADADFRDNWQFEVQADGDHHLWIHSVNGGIDPLCAFLQHLLLRFNPTGSVTFEWANDCSKPRVDAYGGGAAIVTARNIKSMSTTGWLHKHAA